MNIKYKNKKLEHECTSYARACKRYGQSCARFVMQRMGQIAAAESIEDLRDLGRFHQLEPKARKFFAMDLQQPYRLVFTLQPDAEEGRFCARILEIVDYH